MVINKFYRAFIICQAFTASTAYGSFLEPDEPIFKTCQEDNRPIILSQERIEFLRSSYIPDAPKYSFRGIIYTESKSNRLAFNVSGAEIPVDQTKIFHPKHSNSYYPKTVCTAEDFANSLILSGKIFDIGIAQIDSVHFAKRGYLTGEYSITIAGEKRPIKVLDLLNPAINMWIGKLIYQKCWKTLAPQSRDEQLAVDATLSCYNKGLVVVSRDKKGKPTRWGVDLQNPYISLVRKWASAIKAYDEGYRPPTRKAAQPSPHQ